jgi:flagellar biogenesis protein FliO
MLSILRIAALAWFAAAAVDPLLAQTNDLPAPPAWNDGVSDYLSRDELPKQPSAPASIAVPPYRPPIIEASTTPISSGPSTAHLPAATPPKFDSSVQHAVHHAAAVESDDAQRRLAPPTARADQGTTAADRTGLAPRATPDFDLPWDSITTMAAALGIVVGLFLICTWLFRRGAGKAATALPADVVSVLGRVPLAARQVAQLLRVGNKLVLVSMTPTGAETLTEVTDPAEVDRLVGICQQADPHSTTKAFEQVFRQLAREPAAAGFLGQEASLGPAISAFEPIRTYRGETARG